MHPQLQYSITQRRSFRIFHVQQTTCLGSLDFPQWLEVGFAQTLALAGSSTLYRLEFDMTINQRGLKRRDLQWTSCCPCDRYVIVTFSQLDGNPGVVSSARN